MDSLRGTTTASRLGLFLALAATAVGLAACTAQLRPPVIEVTAEEEEAQAERDLAQYSDAVLARDPAAVLPHVDRVRFILLGEWPSVMANCLTGEGFEATATPDGALVAQSPDEQGVPFLIAKYECAAKYPLDPRQNIPLVDDQIRYLYDYYVQVATPCLEGMGFEVPDPPSLQTYIDSYRDAPDWRPYEDASRRSTTEQWSRILKECPENTPGVYGDLAR